VKQIRRMLREDTDVTFDANYREESFR
jgi:hypothetical protein